MFRRKRIERIEPHFADEPCVQKMGETRLVFYVREDNSVDFERDGTVFSYIPPVTNRDSTNQMVLAGLRKLAESDPEVRPTVVDKTGGWTHYLTESPYGSRRKINDVPSHYIQE